MGQPCVHCGEDCGRSAVVWDEKPFCCHGCKTVYQILNEKDLKKYYEIEPMSGIRLEQPDYGSKYAYLDHEEIIGSLIDFSDGGISKVKLYIPGIHCASCIWLLENLNTLNPGIVHSYVNFPRKEVSITFRQDAISLRQLVELLASIHYIPEISLGSLDKKQPNTAERNLLLKIGVAGFSFLNVMMYNFPEYLPGGDYLENNFRSFFGFLSILLGLPVVLYSANDYFISAWKSLQHRLINIDLPIAIGIITLFLQSLYSIYLGEGIGFMDSLVGLVFFLLIGKWYQGRTYRALSFERDYKSYFPVAVNLIRENSEESIPLSRLQTGDQIRVRNQELIPADATLVAGEARIDYSFVTGESIPVPKKAGDIIFAGGRQMGAAIELKVDKPVEQSYLTQLWNQHSQGKDDDSELNSLINRVSKYFTLIILAIAASSALYWYLHNPALAVYSFTSVLIIACPCALALTVPFTFGSTMRLFGRKGFYIKNTQVVEALHKVQAVVFDKTGTLTYTKSLKINFYGEPLDPSEEAMVFSLVKQSTHPLSAALSQHLSHCKTGTVNDFKEIPALGIRGRVDGSLLHIGSQQFVTGKTDADQSGGSRVYVYIDGHIKGYFLIRNHYRKGLSAMIENLKKKYELYLISGDNASESERLKEVFGNDSSLLFNQSPTDKQSFVSKLQSSGKQVLMIGDGLNDAGALMESSVGISIADDVYSFSPACDGILESSQFGQLDRLIRFSYRAIWVVRLSFVISFLYNLAGLFFAVQGMLSPIIAAILMPISSVSVVAFATFSIRWLGNRFLD